MGGIVSAIRRSEWKEFEIESWNDLLLKTFGEINYEPNKYIGKKGLNTAFHVLKTYRNNNGKKPTSNIKGMAGILKTINRGEWKEFGIGSWNHLLKRIFGEVNNEFHKYDGKQGLEKATKNLKSYMDKHGKKPTSNTIGFCGIYKVAQKGEWKNFGIDSWNALLKHIFGEIYIEKNKYIGKKGFKRAKQELKKFKMKNGIIPILKNKGMSGIGHTILRGEWKIFGINSWNDLLKHTFGEINRERNKYDGKEGLNRAIEELNDFKRKYNKKPASNSKGFRTIYDNSRLGKWKEFGINSWNDLLKHTFGEINKEKNKYFGKIGLERARSELIQFEKKSGKKPTTKSKGMNTIYTTARLGKWNEFGINSWKDLINYSFNIFT